MQKFKRHPNFATARTTEILETTLSVMHGDLKMQFRSDISLLYIYTCYLSLKSHYNLLLYIKVTTEAN